MKDLFGEDTDDRKLNRRRGHAGIPGTGPAGETCKGCNHYTHTKPGANTYRKCGLMEHDWTHGPGTDIRAKDPACRYFEKKEPKP